ncbi:MAG: hypothetical protein IPK07_16300 [Deltaproteobacteria bacterium]|nr:hypothetical protein [Deltaproteobacteria bacterium]
MTRSQTRSGLVASAIAVLVVTALSATSHAAYVTTNLSPSSVTTSQGSTGSQPLSVLSVQDLSGTSSDTSKAQRYYPSSGGYVGIFDFTVPSGLDVASASGLSLVANFYGQPKSAQRWTFQVRDQRNGGWVTVGYNDVGYHTWKSLSFSLSGDLSRFVTSGRKMQARLTTWSSIDSADLDFLAFAVTTYTGDTTPPPPPPVGGGTAGVRTLFAGSFLNTSDQINFVANWHDLQITSVGPTKLAAVMAANPSAPVYHYQKVAGIASSDANYSAAKNLRWYGPSGNPVYQTQNGWYWIDIINPSTRAAWIPVLLADIESQLALGYKNLYLDNVAIIDPTLINEYPSNYSDSAYYDALIDVLAKVRAALPSSVKILINSYTGGPAAGLRGLEFVPYIDGLSFEAFSLKASSKWMDRTRWLQQIHDFQYVTGKGKVAVAMDYMNSTDMQRRLFSLGSYLVANAPGAYHRIAATDVSSELQQFPEDALAIGTASGAAVERSDGLVTRAYSGGTVVVNPGTSAITYTMGSGSWQKLSLSGGGAYPSPGSVSWPAVSGTTISVAANSAVIVRPAQ